MADEKILLMDDDPLVQKSVEKLLAHNGYRVTVAANGQEGIDIIKSKELFDMIISDIRMPEKNGVEAISEIRALVIESFGKDIPIIFITGYAEMGQQLNAQGLGEVIEKPFDLDLFMMTVREYL